MQLELNYVPNLLEEISFINLHAMAMADDFLLLEHAKLNKV